MESKFDYLLGANMRSHHKQGVEVHPPFHQHSNSAGSSDLQACAAGPSAAHLEFESLLELMPSRPH